MDYQQFLDRVDREHERLTNKDLRMGQLYFNTLATWRPHIASQVIGKWQDLDPFYNDANIPAFLQFVEDNWLNYGR